MRSFLPLALLFIAFTVPSIAQNEAATDTTPAAEPSASDDVPADLRTVTMFDLFQPHRFNCTKPGLSIKEYEWFANETKLNPTPEGQPGPKLEDGGAVLLIPRMREDDWGNYTCRVEGGVLAAFSARARNIARVPSDTNVVEGQKFSITCKLIGKPYPRVRWTYTVDEELNRTEVPLEAGGRFSAKDSAAGVPGGVLEVSDAVRADAGLYYCEPPEGTPAHSTLRVKDVYAALWPFLGICLEVFILCAIILVYEKRRTKPEMEDSDADTHDQKKA